MGVPWLFFDLRALREVSAREWLGMFSKERWGGGERRGRPGLEEVVWVSGFGHCWKREEGRRVYGGD
jgi:hypothetical protein